MFKKIFVCAALAVCSGFLFPQTFERANILSAGVDKALFAENELTRLLTKDDVQIKLVPQTEYGRKIRDFVFGNINVKEMGYAAEKLYSIKKSDLQSSGHTDFNTDGVSLIMRSISKMQGMQYFSRSRKVWNTLYSESFRVENPEEKKLIPAADITSGSADGQEIFAFMNDHTFGECVYRISYSQKQNEFLMIMQNHSYISYGPVKAVKPQNLKMCVLVADCGDEFIFYIANYTECSVPSILKTRLNNSFEARLEAVYNWFKTQF